MTVAAKNAITKAFKKVRELPDDELRSEFAIAYIGLVAEYELSGDATAKEVSEALFEMRDRRYPELDLDQVLVRESFRLQGAN